MKAKVCLFLLLSLCVLRPASTAEFGYPVGGEPWYFIKAAFTDTAALSKGTWKVTRITVNGIRGRDFLLFQGGEDVPGNSIQGQQPFEAKVRFPWQGKQSYEIEMLLENPKTKKTATFTRKLSSPALKGYWNPDWKNYLALIVSEENGFERPHYPIHATIGVLADSLKSGDEIRVIKAERAANDVTYTEIPSQIYDQVTWADQKILSVEEKDEKTGERIIRYHPTISLSIAFLANLKPKEKATYLVFYNNPSSPQPAYPSDLKVFGSGIGKTIENGFYRVTLNKKSGVIYEIFEKTSKTRLEHKLETNGSIHWNPGVYSPPHTWTHTSDWEDPAFVEVSGPVFYSVRITAPLPHYPQVLASITYHFYANRPFILVETTIHVSEDMFVKALRNGEVVFNKKVFKNVGYKVINGPVEEIDLSRTRMHPEHVIVLRPDTPWVTFYNQDKGVAFANLYLDLAMTNLKGGPASAEQPFVYIQHGPWYYLARGLVYSFGTNNQTRMLPVRGGNVYYERNVFYPFSFKKDRGYSDQVDMAFNMLKYPVSVLESIETYAASPEGWIVPILTEPFEEGVEEAIGGKKKK
ncbi:MAG: hypothetical protein WAU81_08825 [Candidatus Aminicenantales bacterium]